MARSNFPVNTFAALANALVTPMPGKYFRRLKDRLLFKNRYSYPDAMHRLSAVLNQNIETSKIIEKTVQVLTETLRTDKVNIVLFRDRSDVVMDVAWYPQVRFVVFRNKKPIILSSRDIKSKDNTFAYLREKYGIEVLVPMLIGERPIGAIVLGPKISGDSYRDADIQLLVTLSYQAAVSLEKARLFDKLKEYSELLEDRVKERTMQLERLQEEQRQMMMDISHRLQTPLTAVKSELEFLKRQKNPPEHLDTFERSIDGISRFIYDLLNLARLGTRKNGSAMDRVDLSDLLGELIEYFGVMAEDEGISLIPEIEANLFISGNKDNLEELVMNLVSNAFKYLNSSRDKKVVISLKNIDSRIFLEVIDTGDGIAKEDLGRIFERFYRGQAGSGVVGGTGLGLAISKRIVENHAGTITIQSEVGQGTRVIVTLPQEVVAES
jgi:signal transduction histidine kinase